MRRLRPDPRTALRSTARSAHGLVTRSLGTGILNGKFPPGSLLPVEAELMSRFGVSRTALREAMKTLSAKGLLESKAKVGTRVLDESRWQMFDPDLLAWRLEAGMDSHFIASLFEIRQTIEPAAAALAAVRRTDADLAHIQAALVDMGRPGQDAHSHAEADLAFHLAVVAASHNPLMRSIGAVIEAALIAAFTHSAPVRDPELFARSIRDHGLIAEAIERRDPEAASTATAAVILIGARVSGHPENIPPLTAIAIKALLKTEGAVTDRVVPPLAAPAEAVTG